MIVLKTTLDAKTKQLVRTVRLDSGGKVRFFGDIGYDSRQMLSLGNYGIQVMRDRVLQGIGSSDSPMPGLKKGYAIQKTRAGKGNRRDLSYSGDMLNNISVRSVSATQARIDITSAKQRLKARANEQKSPWWGWSTRNLAQITVAARTLFKLNVADFGVVSTGSRRNAKPIWMDPKGLRSTSARLAA